MVSATVFSDQLAYAILLPKHVAASTMKLGTSWGLASIATWLVGRVIVLPAFLRGEFLLCR